MAFSSLTFLLLFLPITLVLYYSMSNRALKNLVLLVVSLGFYSFGEPKLVGMMILSIGVNYCIGLWIEWKHSRLPLVVAVLFNLSLLGYFKYFGFFIQNVNSIFGQTFVEPSIILPIGISFYTFQILSYIVDLYTGKVKAQKRLILLGTYVALFPQLIAGPIVRYADIEQQLEDRSESLDDFVFGSKRFIIGLCKKVLIADQVGFIVNVLTEQGVDQLSATFSWLRLVAFTLQIYYDFSGYSDMAIGLGRMFGFHFNENFNYPYSAISVTDFWRRWHISLSSWFRDYVYYPLGGNRVKKSRWLLNLLIVWVFTGLWHGASWNFVLWGLYYFIVLVMEKKLVGKLLKQLPVVVQWLYTIGIVMVGWLIFMTDTYGLSEITKAMKGLLGAYNKISETTIWELDILVRLPWLLIGMVMAFPLTKPTKDWKYSNHALVQGGYAIGFIMCVIMLLVSSFNAFIYFRF